MLKKNPFSILSLLIQDPGLLCGGGITAQEGNRKLTGQHQLENACMIWGCELTSGDVFRYGKTENGGIQGDQTLTFSL